MALFREGKGKGIDVQTSAREWASFTPEPTCDLLSLAAPAPTHTTAPAPAPSPAQPAWLALVGPAVLGWASLPAGTTTWRHLCYTQYVHTTILRLIYATYLHVTSQAHMYLYLYWTSYPDRHLVRPCFARINSASSSHRNWQRELLTTKATTGWTTSHRHLPQQGQQRQRRQRRRQR